MTSSSGLVGFDIDAGRVDRDKMVDNFMIHERELGALILECNNRKIEIIDLDRMAIEKIINVLIKPITKRRAGNVTKKVKDAVRKSENFLNLTSLTYRTRP